MVLRASRSNSRKYFIRLRPGAKQAAIQRFCTFRHATFLYDPFCVTGISRVKRHGRFRLNVPPCVASVSNQQRISAGGPYGPPSKPLPGILSPLIGPSVRAMAPVRVPSLSTLTHQLHPPIQQSMEYYFLQCFPCVSAVHQSSEDQSSHRLVLSANVAYNTTFASTNDHHH